MDVVPGLARNRTKREVRPEFALLTKVSDGVPTSLVVWERLPIIVRARVGAVVGM